MVCLLLLCSALGNVDDGSIPSHTEVFGAVVSNREKIRSLQVQTVSRQTLPKAGVVRKSLYLDVDAQRWRIDTTGMLGSTETSDRQDEGFERQVSADGGVVYRYYPQEPNKVAIIDTLKRQVDQRSVLPFPDPRNAGLVPVFAGNMGTPFEIAGFRLSLYTSELDCAKEGRVALEPATWKGQKCWKVGAVRDLAAKRKRQERCFFIVPEQGYSVVFLEVKTFRDAEKTPYYVFSVESEVAFHEENRLWFPVNVHYRAIIDGKESQDEVTEIQVVSLNRPIPQEVFTFKGMGVPAGHVVMDLTDTDTDKKVWDGNKVVRIPRWPH